MIDEHDYVYAFECILETRETPRTTDDLLLSLKLTIDPKDPRWSALVQTVEAKTRAGYDFVLGKANLALLCQDFLKKKPKPFVVNSLTNPPDDNEPWKHNIRVNLTTAAGTTEHQETLRKTYLGVAFPHVLKTALTKLGFKKDLQGVSVEDRDTSTFYANGDLLFRARSFFFDHQRNIGWWSVGVGKDHIAATIEATVLGYYAALDPRRHKLPIQNNLEVRENYLAYREQFKLAS